MFDISRNTKDFNVLFDRYKEPYVLFANSYVRDFAAAEDIYMEAVIQCWEKRTEFTIETNLPAYLLTCVRNGALNYLRHELIKADVQDRLYQQKSREMNLNMSSLEACNPSELFSREVQDIITKTLKELPRQTRDIFIKSRFEHKTNREIAEELGISIKTVEFHISKALKLFRLRLKDYLLVFLLFLN